MKFNYRVFLSATILIIFVSAWWYGVQLIQDTQTIPSGLGYYYSDTTHAEDYKVRDFQFYNQDSILISRANFENKIWVTDFFFSTCEGICPIMNTNLGIVQSQYKEDTNVLLLSHTVDPKTDDIPRLKVYSQRMGGIRNKWHFVTGREEDIYELARKSYFVATPKDSTLNEDFVHSQLICLIDPHLHIRGYYDGTNGKDIKKLIEDIQKLKVEYNKDGRQKTMDIFPYFRNNQ